MTIHTASHLIAFWRGCPTRRPPFVHPEDESVLEAHNLLDQGRWTFRRFINHERFYDPDDRKFHLSLLPVPFLGDIKNADIFILLLNPGFRPLAYFEQDKDNEVGQRLRKTLHQDFVGVEYPFRSLDPETSWTGGGRWWWTKLEGLAREIAERRYNNDIRRAVREMAKRIAALQLVPYRSRNFVGNSRLFRELPSTQAVVGFARGELKNRAVAGDATIIVTRRGDAWGLEEFRPRSRAGRDIVIYSGPECRGAGLGPDTRGGRAILRALSRRR